METQKYITLRATALPNGTEPPGTIVSLTRRQAEFLVLGGFIARHDDEGIEQKTKVSEEEEQEDNGTI